METDSFPCKFCDKVFQSTHSRLQHVAAVHSFQCSVCDRIFHKESSRAQHMETGHGDSKAKGKAEKGSNQPSGTNQPAKKPGNKQKKKKPAKVAQAKETSIPTPGDPTPAPAPAPAPAPVQVVKSVPPSGIELLPPALRSEKCIFRSMVTGKTLRINEDGTVDGKGGKGHWAQFTIVPSSKRPTYFQLQNVGDKTHWLSISNNLAVCSNAAKATLFHCLTESDGRHALQADSGLWIAVNQAGGVIAKVKSDSNLGKFVSFTMETC